MRFLANENFPLASVYRLREVGYEMATVVQDSPGVKDFEVMARAASENRVVLTFDRDYGELVYHLRLPMPSSVVYFRYAPLTPEEPAEHLLWLLTIDNLSLDGKFTVVDRGQVRQRPLPQVG